MIIIGAIIVSDSAKLYCMKNINIVIVLILFPILLNAQVDVAEFNSSVGFKHQTGGQIGLLGIYPIWKGPSVYPGPIGLMSGAIFKDMVLFKMKRDSLVNWSPLHQ